MPKATKATYPDEAPVFEVVAHCYRGTGRSIGSIVVGSRFIHKNAICCVTPESHSYSNESATGYDWHYDVTSLKPLTPAAVAMLAIAKESA